MQAKDKVQVITASVMESVFALLSDKLYKVVLYGSYARGDFTPESDIDIMVVLDCSKEEVLSYRKEVSKLSSRIGLEHDIMTLFYCVIKKVLNMGRRYCLSIKTLSKMELNYMDETLRALSQHRIEQAQQFLTAIKLYLAKK